MPAAFLDAEVVVGAEQVRQSLEPVVADIEARAVAGDVADFADQGITVAVALGGLPRRAQQVVQVLADRLPVRRRRFLPSR